jgi:hypothetical protein
MRRIMLILLIMAMLLTPSIVIAGDSITVIDNTAAVFFPSALVFQIEAESATAINKIRLHYRVDRLNYTQVISESWPVFTPDKKVKTEWIWDMRRSSLPVGATVIYWWTIENISGSRMSTPEKSIRFNDSRFQWQELTDHPVSLYWYKGDKEFSKELMDTAHQALELISQDTGASLKTPVHIYIYGSTADLQSAMMFPRGWEGGFAAYEYGTINIGILTNDMAWGKRAIAHELGHLVTHQLTFGPYGDLLPTWLDEGPGNACRRTCQ